MHASWGNEIQEQRQDGTSHSTSDAAIDRDHPALVHLLKKRPAQPRRHGARRDASEHAALEQERPHRRRRPLREKAQRYGTRHDAQHHQRDCDG